MALSGVEASRPGPVREPRGFTDVEHTTLRGLEQVDTGACRQVHTAGINGHVSPPDGVRLIHEGPGGTGRARVPVHGGRVEEFRTT